MEYNQSSSDRNGFTLKRKPEFQRFSSPPPYKKFKHLKLHGNDKYRILNRKINIQQEKLLVYLKDELHYLRLQLRKLKYENKLQIMEMLSTIKLMRENFLNSTLTEEQKLIYQKEITFKRIDFEVFMEEFRQKDMNLHKQIWSLQSQIHSIQNSITTK